MITTPINNGVQGTQNKSATASKAFQLKPEDFIKMMITQLQNQDPMSPAKNEELLAQMSQIGQLQSSTTLQDSIKSMTMQNSLGAASSLIGKTVSGMDDNNNTVGGVVNSIRVAGDDVNLELDNGKSLKLGRVVQVAPTPTATATPTPAPAAA